MILIGHVLDRLRDLTDNSVHCVVTSPPYWGLRDYGLPSIVWGGDANCEHDFSRNCRKCGAWRGQLGLEPTPQMFVEHMVKIFREVRRVLRPDGTLWLNLGDSYGGARGNKTAAPDTKNPHNDADTPGDAKRGTSRKNLLGMPWRVALALQEDGWILRNDHIWHKPNSMPESVRDRASRDHEYIFHFSKGPRYFFDQEATKVKASSNSHSRGNGVNPKSIDGGFATKQNASFSAAVTSLVETRNLRTVWTIPLQSFKGAHFATFSTEIPLKCIKGGTSEKGCCPHCGAPWRRLIEKVRVPTRPGNNTKVNGDRVSQHESSPYNQHSGMIVGNRDPQSHITATKTVGWEKTCKCEYADPVPCTVLEPFLGSGTTATVAEYLGRGWIGIELNEEYAEIARKRIAEGYRPREEATTKRRRRKTKSQPELF